MTGWMLKQVQHDGIRKAVIALLLLLCAFPAFAQTFPPLTGRVVDAANILQPEAKAALEAKLEGVEKATGHQVVIATIPDMQGYPLEDYGYRLGRTWALGDKAKDDGLIILLAPNNPAGQRGPRIEVGYGLEPLVTDAFSSVVANGIMTPMLKAGDIPGALNAGVDAIAEQIKLTPEEAAKRTAELTAQEKKSDRKVDGGAFIFWIIVFFVVILPMVGALSRSGRRGRRHSSGLGEALLWTAVNVASSAMNDGDNDHWGGGGGGGGFGGGGGGFSGGGGSFGGGGASGGW